MPSIKESLYQQCQLFLEQRLQSVQNIMDDIQKSLLSETKSSAGDKHETGRAMLQLEREKAGNQLAEIQKVSEILSKIDASKSHKIVALGSIVFTSKANYFIAISAGELKVKNTFFYAISPNTPIGQLLLSKKEGDDIVFRNDSFMIETVL